MFFISVVFLLFCCQIEGLSAHFEEPLPIEDRLQHRLLHSVLNEYGKPKVLIRAERKSFDALPNENIIQSGRNFHHLNRNTERKLVDGDIELDEETAHLLLGEPDENLGDSWDFGNKLDSIERKKRQAYVDSLYPDNIWKDGVPYAFHPNFSKKGVNGVMEAIRIWQTETCVNFYPRENETQYLFFTNASDGCFSKIGKSIMDGPQEVNIGNGCEHIGITSHEVSHALGSWHHQQRYDRDDYVTFIPSHVPLPTLFNFAKIPSSFMSTYNLPYDIGSVMHYTPTEFSIDRWKPSLIAEDINLQPTMGSMDGPSFLDILLINRHYRCGDLCQNATKPICLNGGYADPRNCTQCKCPSGYSGPRCNLIEISSFKCGGLLPARYSLRRIKVKLTAGLERKKCVYHIRAPPNRRIMIGIEKVKGQCEEGCFTTAMEAKMIGDFRPVGYRVCCQSHSFRRFVSVGRNVPIIIYAYNGTAEMTFFYRWVVETPDAEDSEDLLDSEMKEVYKQDGVEDFSMVVTGKTTSGGENERSESHDEYSLQIGEFGSNGDSDQDFSVYY